MNARLADDNLALNKPARQVSTQFPASFVGDPGLVGSGPVGPCSGIYYNACDRQTDMRTDIAYTYTVASCG